VEGGASAYAERVPANLPSFRGQRQDDVRQLLFQVETMCQIYAHDVCDENAALSHHWTCHDRTSIGGGSELGTYCSTGRFKMDVFLYFEASDYQGTLRLKLLYLREEGDIEDYNGRFAELIFLVDLGRSHGLGSKLVHVEMKVPGVPTPYTTVAVVYDLPDMTRTICVTSPSESPAQLEEVSPVEDTELQNAAQAEVLPATSTDFLGVGMFETDKQSYVSLLMGFDGSQGLSTKYIKRKHLRKLLRKKSEDPAQEFILVLTNETIKRIKRDNWCHPDEPDHVGSEKGRRFLDTDWACPFPLLMEYKDTIFTPELPDRLPAERAVEHRIDVKIPSKVKSRPQQRLSPEQIEGWVREIVGKGLIRPSISLHAAPTFYVRKPHCT
ncbi:TPA: hypothetical protein N0F65_009697, partial [Lagenidium giganteum]